ncbi:hypothetical protein [Grapevine leafroll-associated virus 3m]|nr:hypothetical protein [Grapevine leafroll-associated virus 3m]
MRNISLYYLILRLSNAIKRSNHLDLIFVKEALINYYNGSWTNENLVHKDAKESISKYILSRNAHSLSNALLNAIVTHTVVEMSIETVRVIVGDLIHMTDASLLSVEEAKHIRDSRRIGRFKGKYYYTGEYSSDIAKIRYILVGDSRGVDTVSDTRLVVEQSELPSDIARQLLYSCI